MRHVLAATLAVVLFVAPHAHAFPANVGCAKTVAKATAAYVQARIKALAHCEHAKVKGTLSSGTVCATESKTEDKLDHAADKMETAIGKACGGSTVSAEAPTTFLQATTPFPPAART